MNNSVDQQTTSPASASISNVDRIAYNSWRNPWLILALIAFGLAIWQWIETRVRILDTQQELARRLLDSDTVAKESRMLSRQAQEQSTMLQGKIGELEGQIAESKSQQAMLENLYQSLARNRDEWIVTEVEQSVMLAAQQLQLSRNIQGAVLALQFADSRLADHSHPQFIGLRKVLTRDLDRLRALPQVDLSRMNFDLERVIVAVDALPLAIDVRPRGVVNPKEAAELPSSTEPLAFWKHLAADFWHEIRGLVRIQRFDRDEPALLAPEQSFFLRENLKLRLLNARLALLMHDQWFFRNELKQAMLWIDRYFNEHEESVQEAREILAHLATTKVDIEPPSLNDSLSAIKNLKLGRAPK